MGASKDHIGSGFGIKERSSDVSFAEAFPHGSDSADPDDGPTGLLQVVQEGNKRSALSGQEGAPNKSGHGCKCICLAQNEGKNPLSTPPPIEAAQGVLPFTDMANMAF